MLELENTGEQLRVLGSVGGYWGALESVREYLRELKSTGSAGEDWRVLVRAGECSRLLESTKLLPILSGDRTSASSSAPIIGT